jgi:hypothetical protein
LNCAVQRLEAEIIPQRHAARLERQREVRDEYREICAQILEAANRLAELNDQAMKAFQSSAREFRSDELHAGHEAVLRNAGLSPVHDLAWIRFPGQPSRRDFWANQVYSFAKDLVPENDPVALSRRHQDEHYASECARYDAERKKRTEAANAEVVKFQKTSLAERQTGKWVPENGSVRHPLSPIGLAENLGLIKRV